MGKTASGDIRKAILEALPDDGSSIGNLRLRQRLADMLGAEISEADYFAVRDALVSEGEVGTGKGRGGSVHRLLAADAPLTLAAPQIPAGADAPKPRQATMTLAQARRAKDEVKPRKGEDAAKVIAYRHDHKRKNNPDVGVVTPDNDPEQPRTTWTYDPHIDPALQFDARRAPIENLIDNALASGDESVMRAALEQLKHQAAPYLNWAGKAERTAFEVDTVSLHVHERIDPATILGVIQKRLQASAPSPATAGEGRGEGAFGTADMFRAWFEEPLPLREAVDFYKHERGWSNRLVAGDSLLVMNSLLQKEGMAGQVQMIYIDPPYGIKYGSNFQPFVNKRDVKDRKDEDLTQEPEMIKAFRDTWELGIHSYLTYLRDRLLLAKELLHESGSVFVQIGDDNVHLVRSVLDEILGPDSFVAEVYVEKTSGASMDYVDRVVDVVVWYAKDKKRLKYRQPFVSKKFHQFSYEYKFKIGTNGSHTKLTRAEIEEAERSNNGEGIYAVKPLTSQTSATTTLYDFRFHGQLFESGKRQWATPISGMERLVKAGRVEQRASSIGFVRFFSDFLVVPITNSWSDTGTGSFTDEKVYVVQTSTKIVERCLHMTTDPGDLVLDPTCGSGTTAFVAEKWGRRWVTCDTSRVAVTLAKQRLMTASYDYFELKYPHEGLRGGFIYKTVPHVTLKSIANNPEIDEIWARMHPAIEEALGTLNTALRAAPSPQPSPAGGRGGLVAAAASGSGGLSFTVNEGGRKGQTLDFSGSAASSALQEWEVPFDFPADWPASAREAFDAFHAARRAMQKKMDDSIAAHADQETLYDQPRVSKDKLRITGPFTVEAVPFPSVLSLEALTPESSAAGASGERTWEADASVARSGESLRQHSWRDELLKTGIRGKGGQILKFASLETLPDTRYLHCTGTVADTGERVVVSFGPEHAALEQRQVEMAMREAGELFPRPKIIVFCAFTFDPEAAKDIDNTKGITALKAQMNTDLLTEDLKKARSHNQSFWLMGQPDVELRRVAPPSPAGGRGAGGEGEWYQVEVNGFDYFDTSSGELKSGGKKNIAAWSLDTDYDERSLFPRQVFFPMAGAKDGWYKLKRDIKAELDESRLGKLHGTVSLPFEAGKSRKVAVKIVDDRGIESLKVIPLT